MALDPVGTGPYKLESYKQGIGSRHLRNENYWREGAHLDAIEIFGITDDLARVNALASGDVNLASSISPKSMKMIESTKGVELISIPSGSLLGICLLMTTSPGNNPDFAKGMKLLQRREKAVKSLLKGHGTVGNDHHINEAYGVDYWGQTLQFTDVIIRPDPVLVLIPAPPVQQELTNSIIWSFRDAEFNRVKNRDKSPDA